LIQIYLIEIFDWLIWIFSFFLFTKITTCRILFISDTQNGSILITLVLAGGFELKLSLQLRKRNRCGLDRPWLLTYSFNAVSQAEIMAILVFVNNMNIVVFVLDNELIVVIIWKSDLATITHSYKILANLSAFILSDVCIHKLRLNHEFGLKIFVLLGVFEHGILRLVSFLGWWEGADTRCQFHRIHLTIDLLWILVKEISLHFEFQNRF